MRYLLLTVLFAILQLYSIHAQLDYCFGKDTERDQTRHLATKTAYQIAKGTNIEKQYLVPNCQPKKIWIFHRHGTRLPDKKFIQNAPRLEQLRDEIVKNYRVRQTKPTEGALCPEDLAALSMWKWNHSITPEQEQYLVSQGYDDLRGTARVYQKLYPTLLPREYNPDNFVFRHTDTQRTVESFKAFTEGLFGPNNQATPQPLPERDELLRPYEYCQSWQNTRFKGPGTEYAKYIESELWNRTIANISTRLGFVKLLENSDVDLMYDMCRFDQAWQVDRTSVWCAAFLPEHIKVIEYREDLYSYYKSGYGSEGNDHLQCRTMQDMLEHLSKPAGPMAIANFAHSTGLQNLLSALGAAKGDGHLTADNWQEKADRRWMVSKLAPFAANLVVVKYDCPNDLDDKEKAIFFLNQNAVELDWCKVGLCNWKDVLKHYQEVHNANCNTYYCKDGAAAAIVSMTLLLGTLMVHLFQ